MITSQQIEAAKRATTYSLESQNHGHDDSIRIAYEWLDAQHKTKQPNRRSTRPLKHMIERWSGRYVSMSDVEVAATLHPAIYGEYPWFNISSRTVRPSQRRLEGIGEAGAHPSYAVESDQDDDAYATVEV